MRDILSRITKWWEAGETFGLATVAGTYRSAPRDPGAALAVSSSADHEVVGSVSGGCVEGAVYELSLDVSQTGEPVLETYGVSDDDAFAVGLTCGGIIDIFVERVDRNSFPELGEIAGAVERGEPVAVATVISGPGRIGARRVIWASQTAAADGWHSGASGALGSARLDAAVDDDVRGMLAQGLTGIRRYGERGERRGDDLSVFVNSFAPPPRMLVFGAIDFATAVARVGKFLGYHVTVCDARKVFATASRFPDADEVVVEWPHRFLAADRGGRQDRHLRAHPRPEVRRPVARSGAAHAGRVHRRHGQPADARRPAGAAARSRPDRGRTGPATLADRS